MSTAAFTSLPDQGRRREQLTAAVLLGLATLALLAVFGDESRAAYQTWMDSTAYGHCFFVVPIAAFLAWERRHVAAAIPVRPLPWLAVLAIPAGLVWLVAERLGIMEGQQLVAMACLQLLALCVLGWRLYRALAVPLFYLFFLVPFGAFVTPVLQDFTAEFIRVGLGVIGIPVFTDGYIIQIPEGTFFVAEACAGLRFLIASVAFGVLYACMIYRSPGRRIAFILVSIIIPIIANGFRGLGIVALGHVLGSAEAAAVDHVLYGWIFFSLVILLLIVAGLPFREDAGEMPVPGTVPGGQGGLRATALAVLAASGLIALAPAIAVTLDHRGGLAAQPAIDPVAIRGCLPIAPQLPANAERITWSYSCPAGLGSVDQLIVSVSVLSPRSNAGALVRLRRAITREGAAESTSFRLVRQTDQDTWLMATNTEPDRMVAFASWVDGHPATGGLAQRLRQAWDSITGTAHAPVMVTIATPESVTRLPSQPEGPVEKLMLALIAHNPALSGQIVALSAAYGEGHAP